MPDTPRRNPLTVPEGATKLDQLVEVLAVLRAPGGCAWDAEQTHASLVQYLVEETFELVEAIETGSREDLLEELGDVLYQVLFHADIAAHTPGEEFDVHDVAAAMTAKMVGRHPHVFAEVVADDAQAVVANWDAIKQVEKAHRTSVLDGVPDGMPALQLADKLLGRAAKVGVSRTPAPTTANDEQQLGDELLALVSTARARGLDAERALRGALRSLRVDVRAAEQG